MPILVKRTSVHCEASDHDFYRQITATKGKGALETPFSNMIQAFTAFACLGYQQNTYVPLDKRQEITLAVYFSHRLQIPTLASLAFARLRQENPDDSTEDLAAQLLSTDTIVPIVEGWANGGLRIFRDELESGHNGVHQAFALWDLLEPVLPTPAS